MIEPADLRPGVLIRWTGGRHSPGALMRVVRVSPTSVSLRNERGSHTGKSHITAKLEHVLSHAEIVG